MVRYLVLTLFLLTLSQKIYSQKLLAQLYTTANGLPSNEVFSVHKDKKGFIWIGTDRGLSVFDGKLFKNYTTKEGLCENTILEIKEDKSGRIWCRGFSGLFTIIENNTVYPAPFNKFIEKIGHRYQFCQFEFDDHSNFYLSSKSYCDIYKSMPPYNELQQVSLSKSSISLLKIGNNKFIGSSGVSSKNKSLEYATIFIDQKQKQFKLHHLSYNYFWRSISTSKSILLSTDKTIYSISLPEQHIKQLDLPFVVSSFASISANTFLVGGFDGQLATYDSDNGTYQLLDAYPSSISSIYYENNSCWIASLRNGIYFVPNIQYKILHKNEYPLISMLPISKDSLLILNANSDIEIITNKKNEKFTDHVNQKTLMYWQRFDNSQKKYLPFVGTYNYVIDRTSKKKRYFDLMEAQNWYQTEFIVPTDTILYASYYGGLRLFNQKGKHLKSIGLLKNRATCMYGLNNVLYMGSLKGLFKLERAKLIPIDSNTFFENRIVGIDKIGVDSLLIATQDHGIGFYNVRSEKLSMINQEVGLDKLVIQYVSVDEEGRIWIATAQSLHLLKVYSNKGPELLDVIDLMLGDLSIKEVRSLNKKVFILVGNQVLEIPEDKIQFNSQPFPIVLTHVSINGKEKSLQELATNELLHNENTLLLGYQLISYTQNQQIEYRYQLNNGPWVYTTINEIQLVELQSAKYKLNIQGRLKNGIWSSVIPITFTIKTPFYKTWWFISLVTICSLVLLYSLISFYFKLDYKKRLKQFELTREIESARLTASKSQMNPHFIFNALNSIQNFILKSDKIQAYQYLTDFSTLIRNFLQYSNKDYIKLDKELELIQTYIKIEQLRMPFHFELHLSENLKTSEAYIFTLLLQPCLENAIWHGLNHKIGDKMIHVTIVKVSNKIEINITDNGIGRAQSAVINSNRISKSASVAINNMHSRITSLKLLYKNDIKVQVIDNFDSNAVSTGTTVLINFETIYEQN